MSQHDYVIANASGSAVRTDLNNALGAIQTTNIGSSAPSALGAGQLWIDNSATPWVLKCYDGADHISVGTINASTNAFAPSGVAAALSGGAVTGLTNLESDAIEVKGQALQHIFIRFDNVSGTLKHKIHAEWLATGALGNFQSKITGASTTATATPSVDGSTDFATGVGVNGPGIVLNTAAQTVADMIGVASVDYNGSGAAFQASVGMVSRDVNGTTRVRPEIHLHGSPGGAAWNINTTNLASSKYIVIHLLAALA